jgi:hypothetical protein
MRNSIELSNIDGYQLPEPFNSAFKNGHSIDYKTNPNSQKDDHTVVKEFGYIPQMGGDCSYYAKGLGAFSLSSYGDWGTFFTDLADDFQKKLFLSMCKDKVIFPCRIDAHVKENGDATHYTYDSRGWRKYDEEIHSWLFCKSPYKI